MSGKKVSRNDPCPCGSGRKFKNCCLGKGIDREAQQAAPRPPVPAARPKPEPPGFAALTPFGVVDARLKEVARSIPGEAAWKPLVENLSDATPEAERFTAYRAVCEAGVLPADAASFLFGHAAQWMPSDEDDLDRHTIATLRRHGLDDLADLHARDRLGYDRRYERGRQFFFGPPDEELAGRLRERGIIE
jgi:hypothetical protein